MLVNLTKHSFFDVSVRKFSIPKFRDFALRKIFLKYTLFYSRFKRLITPTGIQDAPFAKKQRQKHWQNFHIA